MKPTTLLLALGLSCLAACSGQTETHFHFADADSAMSQAEAASASGNTETALAAYHYVIEFGHADLKADALQGLLQLQLTRGMESEAMETFSSFTEEFEGRIQGSDLVQFLQTADAQSLAHAGETMLAYAAERFPDIREELTKLEASFADLRANAPSNGSDMKAIGYVDD